MTFALFAPLSSSTTSHSTVSPSPSTAKVLPEVILFYGSLVYKYIFLGVVPVDETISISYTEPFYSSQNLLG